MRLVYMQGGGEGEQNDRKFYQYSSITISIDIVIGADQ